MKSTKSLNSQSKKTQTRSGEKSVGSPSKNLETNRATSMIEAIRKRRARTACLMPTGESEAVLTCHEYDFCSCDIDTLLSHVETLEENRHKLEAHMREAHAPLVKEALHILKYYNSTLNCDKHCDAKETGHHEPECSLRDGLRQALRDTGYLNE